VGRSLERNLGASIACAGFRRFGLGHYQFGRRFGRHFGDTLLDLELGVLGSLLVGVWN
jgi:hypothetical protein